MNRNVLLWIGVLGGPLTWLASFEARFALAPWACTFQSKAALFGVAVVAILLCATFALLSWRQWKLLGQQRVTAEGSPIARENFMAVGGIVLSGGCLLIVLAQSIPELILGACQ